MPCASECPHCNKESQPMFGKELNMWDILMFVLSILFSLAGCAFVASIAYLIFRFARSLT